ncbi:MAG: hypothetical protein KDA45_12020, partial [Planctomycetales bacterium]|nr:hypothetical protein [Planctomycetales bacterium]
MSLCLVVAAAAGCSSSNDAPWDLTQATYVGQDSCLSCHQEQVAMHRGSHHDLAMQPATEQTVRGDFNNATLVHHGVTSRMFRSGKKFMVHTEGPDGNMADFQIQYVFGFEPLQQYMVEFPSAHAVLAAGEIPRVQVLRLCWNTEEQSWFYLPPPDVPEKLAPSDDLHWTGIAQRWNNMCAECHSTNYQKNFIPPDPHQPKSADSADSAASATLASYDIPGAYHSTFSEINVSCEACHGPGSVHVDLASRWFPGWNRERGYGLANLKASAENQIQACAPCHSRRSVVHGGFQAGDNYYDFYANQLL